VASAQSEGRHGAATTTQVIIRVDAELSDELTGSFPHLVARRHRPSTTLTGEVADQQELQGLLNLLNSLGIAVLEVTTIPTD
jgi:hypothetical protein